MSDPKCPQLTPLELALSENEYAKQRKIRYAFVALEFRHWNLEMLLRVMQKLVSYGRLSGSVFFVSWSECATFASHYTNSGALLTNYSTSGIARTTRQKRAPEMPTRNPKKTNKQRNKQDKRR